MRISYDPSKNARNLAERGLPFDRVTELDWKSAVAREDLRKDYGERRLQILGLIDDRLHAAVVTIRGETLHVISFRKANKREVKRYADERRFGFEAGR